MSVCLLATAQSRRKQECLAGSTARNASDGCQTKHFNNRSEAPLDLFRFSGQVRAWQLTPDLAGVRTLFTACSSNVDAIDHLRNVGPVHPPIMEADSRDRCNDGFLKHIARGSECPGTP